MASDSLPDYERPPVVETVLGAQFAPLASLKNAHLGAFWKTLGPDWADVSDAAPLEPQFETFTETSNWGRIGLQLRLMQEPPTRLRIKNVVGDEMIQVQNGRLHFNWLGETGQPYPRYAVIAKKFRTALHSFQAFIAAEGLEQLSLNQWEVTYVNHIQKGTVWDTPADWTFFRLLQSASEVDASIRLESLSGEWHFEIPPRRGRLHVQWNHGRKDDPSFPNELVTITLTARGPLAPGSEQTQALAEGLALGRETIVRSFRDFMSDDANKYWELHHVYSDD